MKKREQPYLEQERLLKAESFRLLCAKDVSWADFQFMVGVGCFFLPLRSQLQRLARRHEGDPMGFVQSAWRVLRRRAQELGLPPFPEHPDMDGSGTRLPMLPKRARKLALQAPQFLKKMLTGRLKLSFQDVDGALHAMASRRPGREPVPKTIKIRRLFERGIKRPSAIARKIFPTYATASGRYKRDMLEQIREAIRPLKDSASDGLGSRR